MRRAKRARPECPFGWEVLARCDLRQRLATNCIGPGGFGTPPDRPSAALPADPPPSRSQPGVRSLQCQCCHECLTELESTGAVVQVYPLHDCISTAVRAIACVRAVSIGQDQEPPSKVQRRRAPRTGHSRVVVKRRSPVFLICPRWQILDDSGPLRCKH